MKLETIINIAVNLFNKVLAVDCGWDFAVVGDNTPAELKYSISAAYSKEENVIIINPLILDIVSSLPDDYQYATIFAKVGHEARHAWQQKKGFFDSKYQSYNKLGESYLKQEEEIDAFAFEEAILKVLIESPSLEINFQNNESNQQLMKVIHSKSKELMLEYKELITKLL